MSVVGSDSEVEEVAAMRKITPRVVRRPQVARRREAVGEAEESEDSDDASFFTLGGQQASKVYSSEEERVEEAKQGQASRQTSVESIVSSSYASESEEDEQEQEEVEGGRGTKRARSVSLTPPPSPGVRRVEKSRRVERETRGRPRRAAAAAAVVVDDEEEDDVAECGGEGRGGVDSAAVDLDPSLLAAINGADAVGGAVLEKVQIEFRLIYDDQFLNYDVLATWIDKRWRRVKRSDRGKIRKKLDERTAVVVYSTDFVAHALQVFSDNFPVDVMATDPVLMQGSTRVFSTSRLVSLGNEPVHYIDVYPRSVYNRMKAQESLDLKRREDEQAQMLRDMEIARELRSNAVDTQVQGEDEPAAAAEGIRIKIRDHGGKDTLLMVAPTTTVQSIIDSYRKIAGLGSDVRVTLEFDDESLDPKSTVGETEIEDDDMLTVFCR